MNHESVNKYYKDSTDKFCREIDMMDPLKGHGNAVCDIVVFGKTAGENASAYVIGQ